MTNNENPASGRPTFRKFHFKDLVDSFSEDDDPQRSILEDIQPQNPLYTKYLSFKNSIKKKSNLFGSKFAPFGFIVDLFNYLRRRVVVFSTLVSVFIEVIGIQVDFIKRKTISKLFWGRGYGFRFALQGLILVLVISLLVSNSYRGEILTEQVQAGEFNRAELIADKVVLGSTVTEIDFAVGNLTLASETYIVKAGETLSQIAVDKGRSLDTLKWANGIADESSIKPGDELVIPPGDGILYEVKSGDTLASIAKKYESNAQNISTINFIEKREDEELDSVGEEIFLPDGVLPESERPQLPEPEVVAVAPPPATSLGVSRVVAPTPPPPPPATTTNVTVSNPSSGRFLQWPVQGGAGVLTNGYSGWHNGIDIASPALPNIVASASGTVTFAGCQSWCGALGNTYGGSGLAWTIVVNHGNGFQTSYSHLKNIYVSSGQQVAAGQVIGQMGSTGNSTGPHVHFELDPAGSNFTGRYNPRAYMF